MNPGDIVKIHDRFRFANPIKARVECINSENNSIKVTLLESDEVNYLVGAQVVVLTTQVTLEEEVKKDINLDYKPISSEALELSHPGGDRNSSYGPPLQAYDKHAEIFNLINPKGIKLDREDMLYAILAIKLGRNSFKVKRDNLVDAVAFLEFISIDHEVGEDLWTEE